jgi:hypothetical protein
MRGSRLESVAMDEPETSLEDNVVKYCTIAFVILMSVYALLCIYDGTVYLLKVLGLENLI